MFARHLPRARLVSAVLVGAALIFLDPLRQSALTVLRLPFLIAKTGVAVLISLPQLPSLARQNDALRAELLQRQVEDAQAREGLRHAQQAGRLLETVPPGRRGLVALVIGRSTIPTQQTVLLDHGERQGLSRESVILDAAGLVGRVTELHAATALVTLLTDPESRVAALVERSRETGLLVGRGRGRCELLYLDVDADVQEGDRVVTAGLGGQFPKGMPLGTVGQVVRDEQVGAAWASVAPAARLGRLEEVLCLPPDSS
ncbi:MAG: rod shape-determining protein MreC [Candidatus Omnitrophica bacterium]|nr:rod shape-determining protein MreC [Candidatus Omnitrophota bacterium]